MWTEKLEFGGREQCTMLCAGETINTKYTEMIRIGRYTYSDQPLYSS